MSGLAPLLSAAALASVSTPILAAGWACDRSPLVITNARLWNDGRPLAARELVIVDGRIRAVGRYVARPKGSRIIDARGAWLLPGLIDSHVHFGRPPGVPPELLPKPYPGAWPITGRQTLASGVTTVRVHYSDFEKGPRWAREAADDCNPAPAILLGSGGLLGGKPSEGAWMTQVSGPDDARQKVREVAAVGATWMELHDTQKFSADEIHAITDEARKAAVHLVGAGESFEEAKATLDAGVNVLDHFDASSATAYPTALIEKMRRQGTFVIAPIGFFTRYNAYRADPSRIDARLAQPFDQPAIAAAQYRATLARFEKPPPEEQNLVDDFAAFRAMFRQLLNSGVKLVAGSDSGSQGNFQTDAIWWELRSWHENGASPEQILTAATKRPAEMLELPDRGELAVGRRGDFLIYDGDLRKGEFALAHVRYVGRGGVVFVEEGKWVGP